jgi:transposase
MKRIRDRVGGLDVHRDTVVASARVVDPDGSVHVTKQSFSTTSKGRCHSVVATFPVR